jgi:hypothetical protein
VKRRGEFQGRDLHYGIKSHKDCHDDLDVSGERAALRQHAQEPLRDPRQGAGVLRGEEDRAHRAHRFAPLPRHVPAKPASTDRLRHGEGQTFDELKARIAKTLDFIDSAKPAQIDGSEAKEIVLKLGGREVKFSGMQYLLGSAYPNFYFHAVTAYDILRHNGVEIGKRDFLGNP